MAPRKGGRVTAKAVTVPVPATRQEADDFLAAIAAAQREIALATAAYDESVDILKRQLTVDVLPHETVVRDRTEGLRLWAEANRAALTHGGAKSVKLLAGTLGWRTRPPSVTIDGPVDDLIEYIEDHGLETFLRVKTGLDKEAMLADPAAANQLPGVTVGSTGEDFYVEPAEIETTTVAISTSNYAIYLGSESK